jgi:AAA domain
VTRDYFSEAIERAKRERERMARHGPDLTGVPLTLDAWLKRDLPEPDYILGKWLTTTSRSILNAPTGAGKTNFAVAMGAHMSAGVDFLHWKVARPSRVLFVDGEMSRRLLKQRLEDAVRRLGAHPLQLHVLSHEDIPSFQPLNTEAGMVAITAVISQIEPDCVIFDNVMSLVAGSMKDEEGWQDVLPLVTALTANGIGQLWVHHTGHDTTKGYGTKTREWQMDTVIHLTEIARPDTDVSFSLEFTKARERTPDTRSDFEEVTIALVNDEWITSAKTVKRGKVSPVGEKYFEAFCEAISESHERFDGQPAAELKACLRHCERKGLIDPVARDNTKRAKFSKYKLELFAANRVACNENLIWLLK